MSSYCGWRIVRASPEEPASSRRTGSAAAGSSDERRLVGTRVVKARTERDEAGMGASASAHRYLAPFCDPLAFGHRDCGNLATRARWIGTLSQKN